LARRGRRGVALSVLSGLHVLVGGGLIAALADRGLILRSGLSSRVLLSLWLRLIGRLLCSAASLACRRLVLRLVLRRRRVGLAAALSGRVLLRPALALTGGRLASAGRLAALLSNLVRQPQRGH